MKQSLRLLAIATGVMAASGTWAATANFNVTATVADTCVIDTAPGTVAFGTVDFTDTNVDASTTVDFTCTVSASYTSELNDGSNASVTSRRLNDGGTNYLDYGLYSDAGRTTAWGDGVLFGNAVTGTATGSSQTQTIYGRIATVPSTVPAGSYTDTVTYTITP